MAQVQRCEDGNGRIPAKGTGRPDLLQLLIDQLDRAEVAEEAG